MKRYILLGLVALAGCGGSGGGSISNAGHWTGTWSQFQGDEPPPGDSGTFDLNIAADGAVTGSSFNVGKNDTAAVTGSIKDGQVSLLFDYPDRPDWTDCVNINNVVENPSSMSFRLRVNSEEANRSDRTVHVFSAAVALQKN